eukprot:TRINITY_DN223_c0_g1_i4.p2 TRINITY_DN223_c0_g1~~TRINITY_DN223_c0_g1_i4.p2  ORF type:complete len:123 (+),score=24.80 TRINITY_DN223_c0_g1_i4:2232-2600(+)
MYMLVATKHRWSRREREALTYVSLSAEFSLLVKTDRNIANTSIIRGLITGLTRFFLLQVTQCLNSVRNGENETKDDEIGNESNSFAKIIREYFASNEFAHKPRERKNKNCGDDELHHEQEEH